VGIMPYQARKIAAALGLKGDLFNAAAKFVTRFQHVWECDAALVEINPMWWSNCRRQGNVVALDAKISLDDNGLYRHADIQAMRDLNEEAPLETRPAVQPELHQARRQHRLSRQRRRAGDGTMDIISISAAAGELPRRGRRREQGTGEAAFKIILQDPNVKGILVNIFAASWIATSSPPHHRGDEGNRLNYAVVRLEGNNAAAAKNFG